MAAQEGSMVKRLHSGLACEGGVRSAQLAAVGFTGIADVLEADFGGFCSTMVGGEVVARGAHLGARRDAGRPSRSASSPTRLRRGAVEHPGPRASSADGSGPRARALPSRVRTSTHADRALRLRSQPSGVTAAQMSIPYGGGQHAAAR